ncbi:hypothetical protein AKJ51_02215 [candidate division MSBL1 archaeon SCGC-AAA382A20]|uniref:Uncharacterized protein n=1 Tax=candidate division MSBL1 archaeon SCGC-AAA382A20 TaxID=1698280 RepID=A0A133VKP5_9EURY|nr:hypothetical protein AKJ51_02215 [candidate division MSBL1 archaeon SCGC-AAA382A20]
MNTGGDKIEIEVSTSQTLRILTVLVAVSIGLSGFSLYQVYSREGISKAKSSTQAMVSGGTADITSKVEQVREEVLPEEGSPTGYGVKYSTAGMQTLVNWFQSTSLSSEGKDRYANIGSNDGTACEYCCGATSALRSNGQIACGCKHNYAIAGLIKYLVKNTDKSDQEILKEVKDWKGYFFPKQTLSKELQERGISPEAAGLPQMRGGC